MRLGIKFDSFPRLTTTKSKSASTEQEKHTYLKTYMVLHPVTIFEKLTIRVAPQVPIENFLSHRDVNPIKCEAR